MKIIIQSVSSASVEIDNKVYSKINKGILVYLAMSKNDSKKHIDWVCKKILTTRIFPDSNKGFQNNIEDIQGEILLIPQFTLYGDLSQSTKPNFKESMSFLDAKTFFEKIIDNLNKNTKCNVSYGKFGADMIINSSNIGPKTLILEK